MLKLKKSVSGLMSPQHWAIQAKTFKADPITNGEKLWGRRDINKLGVNECH